MRLRELAALTNINLALYALVTSPNNIISVVANVAMKSRVYNFASIAKRPAIHIGHRCFEGIKDVRSVTATDSIFVAEAGRTQIVVWTHRALHSDPLDQSLAVT